MPRLLTALVAVCALAVTASPAARPARRHAEPRCSRTRRPAGSRTPRRPTRRSPATAAWTATPRTPRRPRTSSPARARHRNVYLVNRKAAADQDRLALEHGQDVADLQGPRRPGERRLAGGRRSTATTTPTPAARSRSPRSAWRSSPRRPTSCAGDGNGHADVFVKRMPGGKLTRIATPGAASARSRWTAAAGTWPTSPAATSTARTCAAAAPQRIAGRSARARPQLSANGKITVFSRNGVVYVNRQGEGGTHRVGPGTDPTSDDWGRYVAYTRGSDIWQAQHQGRAARAQAGSAAARAPSIDRGRPLHVLRQRQRSRHVERLRASAHLPGRRHGPADRRLAARQLRRLSAARRARLYMCYIGPK